MDISHPEDLFSLKGRVALVTGAAGHLGQAIVGALAGAGAILYLNGRRPGPLEEVRDRLRAAGTEAHAAPFDVLDQPATATFMADLQARHGRLDVLVNNAYSGRTGTLETAGPADYANAFALAVQATADLTKQGLPLMKAAVAVTGQAAVINIASMYGMVSPDPAIYGDTGHNSPPHYGAAKAGLLQWTRYAAVHMAHHRVRVNAISPGPFPKPKVAQTMPALWAVLEQKTPMKRLGQPSELQGAALFLASDASSFVTGINLPVDGGWTAW